MKPVVSVTDLNVSFHGERTVHAVNGVSLEVRQGEVLGLLGESGSGKSVTMRALMRLLPKKRTRITGGIEVDGRDVLSMGDDELSAMRGKVVSMIFQEPALALDPVYTIGDQIAESVVRHEGASMKEGRVRALEMLANTSPFDVTGHPAMNVPCGMSNGLPIGMMLIGRDYTESTILRASHAFEMAADWQTR